MTYNVFGGTLSLTQSINHLSVSVCSKQTVVSDDKYSFLRSLVAKVPDVHNADDEKDITQHHHHHHHQQQQQQQPQSHHHQGCEITGRRARGRLG